MTKKSKSKFLVILFAMLLVFSVTACNGKKEDSDTGENKKTENVKDDNAVESKNDDTDKKTDDVAKNDNDKKDDEADTKVNNEDDNKVPQADEPETDEDDNSKDTENQDSDILKRSGVSPNGRISFLVDEDDYLLFSVDPTYDFGEEPMMYIVPKGEYTFGSEADAVALKYEYLEDEPDENGRGVFEFHIYKIEPGEYDMVLSTDEDEYGYICAKWSIKIVNNDLYEIDFSDMKEYDRPEGLPEREVYIEVTPGVWPDVGFPEPAGCEVLFGGDNASGVFVIVKWDSAQNVLDYIEVLKSIGVEENIDIEQDGEISWDGDSVRIMYTEKEFDEDTILFKHKD